MIVREVGDNLCHVYWFVCYFPEQPFEVAKDVFEVGCHFYVTLVVFGHCCPNDCEQASAPWHTHGGVMESARNFLKCL